MKRLIFKFILLLGLLFFIKKTSDCFLPTHYSLIGSIKIKESLLMKYQPNALFIGTSRTHRGIQPEIIDSLNIPSELVSFNFGLSAFTLPYTSNWLLNNLNDYPNIKYVFIELTGPMLDLNKLKEWLSFTLSGNNWQYDTITRNQFLFHTIKNNSRYDKILNSWFSPKLNFINLRQKNQTKWIDNGFHPLEKSQSVSYNLENINLTNELTKRVLLTQNFPNEINIPIKKTIDHLLQVCKQQKIKCYFYPPPFIVSEPEAYYVSSAINYLKQENESHIIYPKDNDNMLLSPEYRHDLGHYNKKGALIYSHAFGKVLQTKLNKEHPRNKEYN